jgi:hypothetical protein
MKRIDLRKLAPSEAIELLAQDKDLALVLQEAQLVWKERVAALAMHVRAREQLARDVALQAQELERLVKDLALVNHQAQLQWYNATLQRALADRAKVAAKHPTVTGRKGGSTPRKRRALIEDFMLPLLHEGVSNETICERAAAVFGGSPEHLEKRYLRPLKQKLKKTSDR